MLTIFTRRNMIQSFGAAMLVPARLAATPEMLETEDAQEGPFYKPGAPKRSVLMESGMKGTPLELSGRVYATDGRPLAGAAVDLWHADSAGEYDNKGFNLRGIVETDDNGIYKVKTIVPQGYNTGPTQRRPAHIHCKVRAKGCNELTTELYFKGDPHNLTDFSVRPSLILRPKATASGKLASFNFVLKPV